MKTVKQIIKSESALNYTAFVRRVRNAMLDLRNCTRVKQDAELAARILVVDDLVAELYDVTNSQPNPYLETAIEHIRSRMRTCYPVEIREREENITRALILALHLPIPTTHELSVR